MATGNPSGSNPFDPCRQWLGISALELDDPRKLLGLESLDDPIRILQAAEARIVRLQGVDAGPYEVARRALVARIEEARDRLLASVTGGPIAPAAAAGSLAMPPSPTAAQDEATEPSPAFQPVTQPAPFAAPHYAPTPYASPFGSDQPPASSMPMSPGPPGYNASASPNVPAYGQAAGGYPHGMPGSDAYPPPNHQYDGLRGTGPIYRRSSSSGPLLLLVGALFTAVAVLGLFAMNSPSSKSVASTSTNQKQTKKTRPAPPKPPKTTLNEPSIPPEPPTRTTPEPKPEPPKPEPPKPEPPKPEPPKPEPPKPEPPKPEPPKPEEPDPIAKIDEAVKRCLEALVKREYDTATQSMKAVDGLAPKKREEDRIAGWLQLATYAKGFYDYRDEAIAAMKPGDEYDVKSKKIAVVEATDKVLKVKVAGQVKDWTLDEIPGAVLQAVVESWFDDNPANQLYLGAYHFTKPEPDLEQAEACWNKAKAGGADAALLIPLLTDPVVLDATEP